MVKLLICDDEPWICALFHKFIDCEKLGVELLGYAYDGISALDRILNEKPEIVITDIKMPGLDGLELIRKVREAGLPVRFVIVSGFGTFDYARQAIRYQVEDYLVKPINRENVCQVLEKLCAAIKAEKESRSDMDQTLNDLAHSSSVARRYFLSNVIFNPAEIANKTMEQINEEYRMHFAEGLFQILILSLLPWEKQMQASDNIQKIDAFLCSVFREQCLECESYIDKSGIIFLLNYPAGKSGAIEKTITHYFKSMLHQPEYADFFRMLLLVDKPIPDFSRIAGAYATVKSLLPLGIFRGYNCICSSDGIESPTTGTYTLEPAMEGKLREAIGRTTMNALYNALYDFFLGEKAAILRTPSSFPAILSALCACLAELTESSQAAAQAAENHIFSAYIGCGNLDELCEFLASALYPLVENHINLRASQKSLPIQSARQYIAQHYAEPLTLESVASQVFLSPSYFSTLFKKELQATFGDYLTDVRIKAAKSLLAAPQYTIAQVAELVGYSDAKYFSRIFYKRVGLKPVEYRKLRAADLEDEFEQ